MATATVTLVSSDDRTNPKPGNRGDAANGLLGTQSLARCKLRKYKVSIANDGDEFETGLTGIIETAWAGDAFTDQVQPSFSQTGRVSFNCTAGAATGTLYVWSRI